MKKCVKLLLSMFLVIVLFWQVISPGAIAIEYIDHQKYTVNKSADKGVPVPILDEGIVDLDKDAELSTEHIEANGLDRNITPIVAEDISMRAENAKYYRHDDGNYTVVAHPFPVHYKDDQGNWQDINNSLVFNNTEDDKYSGFYTTAAADYKVTVPQYYGYDNGVSIEKNSCIFSMELLMDSSEKSSDNSNFDASNPVAIVDNDYADQPETDIDKEKMSDVEKIVYENREKIQLSNQASSVRYNNIVKDTDLEYVISSAELKENIIISKPQNSYNYSFKVSLEGLYPQKQKDGSIALFAKDNKVDPIFVIEAPYMFDANKEVCNDVTMEFECDSLVIKANPEWINDPSRVFPVVVDPSIQMQSSTFQDAYVSSALKNQNYGTSRYLYAGKGLSGVRRTYIKFSLPNLPAGSVVTYADCSIKQFSPDYADTSLDLYAFDLTGKGSWNESSIKWNNQPLSGTINNPQSGGAHAVDFTAVKSATDVYYGFNITRTVKNWCETGVNNGFAISTNNENTKCQACFYSVNDASSANWPLFIVDYNISVGLEDEWSYENIDLGRSGDVYVNDYNGSMTYIHEDIQMTGNRLPINISHIYNSNNDAPYSSCYPNMFVGKNFHLNIQQMVIPFPSDNYLYQSGYRYIYYDEDGTIHYFRNVDLTNPNHITEEYDYLTEIVQSGSDLIIRDSKNNKKYFNSTGVLYKIEDSNGNTQTITYNNGKITGVTDSVGRTVSFIYYNECLIGITNPLGVRTSFTFSESTQNGKLIQISDPGSNFTLLGYNTDASLSSLVALNGSRLSFSYKSTLWCGKRVSYIYQYDKNGQLVDYLQLNYVESNTSGIVSGNTVVKNKNNDSQMYLFDEYGQATEITNKNAQTKYAVYGGNPTDLYQYAEHNDLTDISELHTISTNLLKNHGFERSDYWTALQSTTAGSYGYSTENSKNGNYSMKAELTGNVGVFEIDQDFNASAGKDYVVAVDINIPEKLEVSGNNGVMFGFVYYLNGHWQTDGSYWISSTNGWERFSHVITIPEGTLTNCHVYVELARTKGVVYFDNIQVEQSGGERYYNLVENSDFSNAPQATTNATGASAYAWSKSSLSSIDGVQVAGTHNEFRISGGSRANKMISQSVPVKANAGETLIIGGKAAAYATMDTYNNRKFAIIAQIYSSPTTLVETIEIPFDKKVSMAHQTKATFYTLKTPCDHIVYSFAYYKHADSAAFDNAFIYIGSYGQHYMYNFDGVVVKERNDNGESVSYTYSGSDVRSIKQTVNGVEQTVAEINYDANHNITSMTNNIGTEIELEYVNGQITEQTIKEDANSIRSSTTINTYIQGGNYIKTTTNEEGGVTTYYYDNNDQAIIGLVEAIEDPDGNITHFSYDPATYELISVTGNADQSLATTINYSTSDDLLQSISRNNTVYAFEYDSANRVTGYKIGNQSILTNAYDSRNRLSSQTYANGAVYTLLYDSNDRLSGEVWNDNQEVKYFYNDNDRLSKIEDLVNNKSYKYEYAFYNLPFRITGSDGTKTLYDYDLAGNLALSKFYIGDELINDVSIKNDEKGNPNEVFISSFNNTLLQYHYDDIKRLIGYSNGPLITNLEYANESGNLISEQEVSDFNGTIKKHYEYSYDTRENITEITDMLANSTTEYNYDGLNRLISELNGSGITVYSYDIGGNILSVKKNNVIQHNYTYNNSNWKDQLTAIDNNPITYDQNGNPLTYNGYTFSWQHGNRLAAFSGNGTNITYTYDAFGHRTQQTVNGTTINYIYSGDLLMRQYDGVNTIDFAYDSANNMIGFKYNEAFYYYLKNQQGDVLAIVDENCNIVAEYTYDAYGNIIAYSGAMASVNPIRYRSYYNDPETGWYYLQSRYYNPDWRRFLNADTTFIADNDILNSTNMYAYCNNNPVVNIDVTGTSSSKYFDRGWSKVKLKAGLAIGKINAVLNLPTILISGCIGDKIMKPLGNIFMEHIAPVITTIMETAYENFAPDQKWYERQYPFRDIPLLQLRTYFPQDMSMLAGLGAIFLDFHKYKLPGVNKGNYTTIEKTYQWQKYVGYNWWYDWFFSLGGPNDNKRFPFEVIDENNGKTTYYVIWCWKGDYWNLGAGAEIGIYKTTDPIGGKLGYFQIDTENLKLTVCMNIAYDRNGDGSMIEQLTENFYQTNWWVTSFTPSVQSANSNWINVEIKAAFANGNIPNDLMTYFYEQGVEKKRQGEHDWNNLTWETWSRKLLSLTNCGNHPTQCTCLIKPCCDYDSAFQFIIRF